jgi:sugar lactone lactonase YvrE
MKHQFLPIAGCCLALAGTGFAQKKIPNHAVANLVLGQTDFVSGTLIAPPSSFSLNTPAAVVVDPVSRKVFVSDYSNGRVLRYSSAASLTNGAGAEAVFGKASFGETIDTTTGQQGMSNNVSCLFLDRKGRLWVADADNERVLCFEAAVHRSSHPHADRVFGQPDFDTVSSGTTAAKMDSPVGVWVDVADRLWVSDTGNHRVLRFDSISTKANGAAANGVLGQSLFTTDTQGSGAGGMNSPVGICISPSGTLFVADAQNHRVLRFANAASLGNGANATGVLGQLDFTTTSPGISATRFFRPYGVWPTPTDDLWVLEFSSHRALRFANASTSASGSAANGVVGQPDFTSANTATTNRSLKNPAFSPFADSDGSLWIADTGNHRVLRFPPDVTLPILTVAPTPPKKTTAKNILIKGIATDFYGIARIQYRINGGTLKNATGTGTWSFTAKLKTGNNTITLNAVDSVGNLSATSTIKIKRKSS